MRQKHTVQGARHPVDSPGITAVLPSPWVPWDLLHLGAWVTKAISPSFGVPSAPQGWGQRKWSLRSNKRGIIKARHRLRCWGKQTPRADVNGNISLDPGCVLPAQPWLRKSPSQAPHPGRGLGLTAMPAPGCFLPAPRQHSQMVHTPESLQSKAHKRARHIHACP